jgi:hypothetical protein
MNIDSETVFKESLNGLFKQLFKSEQSHARRDDTQLLERHSSAEHEPKCPLSKSYERNEHRLSKRCSKHSKLSLFAVDTENSSSALTRQECIQSACSIMHNWRLKSQWVGKHDEAENVSSCIPFWIERVCRRQATGEMAPNQCVRLYHNKEVGRFSAGLIGWSSWAHTMHSAPDVEEEKGGPVVDWGHV